MRVLKRLSALLAAAVLLLSVGCASRSGFAPGEAEILESAGLRKRTTYNLQEIAPAEVTRSASLTVNESWQMVRSVRTGNVECRLKSINVARGQTVEAGDIVAVLQGLGSEADVELKRLEISAYESNQAELLAWYAGQIAAAEAMPGNTEAQRKKRSLQLEYAQLEYRKYELQSEYTRSTMERQLQALEEAAGEIVITAPVSGSIHNLSTRYAPGDLIPANSELCSVYDSAGLRFYGTSSIGAFVYGREVTVTMQKGSRRAEITGRVVSSPEVLGGNYPGNVILMEVDAAADELLGTQGEADVSYTVLSGVFAVPKNAVATRDGVSCVDVLIGDTVCTRNVVRGPTVGGSVAILHGLKEGDRVVVSSYNS